MVASDAKLVDGKVVGDPTEGALLVLGHKAGLDIDATRESLPRLATLPFDPGYKLMATFNSAVDASGRQVVRCFVKGAVPAVMARAATALAAGETIPWDAELVARAEAQTERMGGEGRRVMAAATRDLDPAGFDPDGDLLAYVTELRMVSLVGMVDPPREDAKAAIAGAQAGHIRVRMVTGDDVTTGAAIARQLGIPGEAVLGADFAAMSADEQLARIDGIGVVGRVAPEHKVLLADTLKKKGDVVAMTGDGVNDAPAIKAADIGIAMGSGTDVAKNAGRMILSDDKFATIVYAVEQGRRIYDNLTKYIRFVLLLLVTFVLTFLGATVFNIAAGEPFTPPQVLWIHFVVNASFGFALGFDRESPGLMRRRPRPRGVGAHPARTGHGRSRRTGDHRRAARTDQARSGPLRQRRDRSVDRVHRLRPLSDRGRVRVPQRDGFGADDVHLRQQADELGGTGPVRTRGAGDPAGRLPPHPRDDADQRTAVRLGAAGRPRAPAPVGTGQAPGPSVERHLTRRGAPPCVGVRHRRGSFKDGGTSDDPAPPDGKAATCRASRPARAGTAPPPGARRPLRSPGGVVLLGDDRREQKGRQ